MIDEQDISRLKEIFVTRKECDEQMDGVKDTLSADKEKLAVINTKLSLIMWLLGTVGAAVVAMLVKTFWGGA